jgi:hypothetical protein
MNVKPKLFPFGWPPFVCMFAPSALLKPRVPAATQVRSHPMGEEETDLLIFRKLPTVRQTVSKPGRTRDLCP